MPCFLGLYPFGIRLRFQESTMLRLANRYARRLLVVVLIFMALALVACDGLPETAPGDSGYAGVPQPTPTAIPPIIEPYQPNDLAQLLGILKKTDDGFTLETDEGNHTYQVEDRWHVARDYLIEIGGGEPTALVLGYFLTDSGRLLICGLSSQANRKGVVVDRCPTARG